MEVIKPRIIRIKLRNEYKQQYPEYVEKIWKVAVSAEQHQNNPDHWKLPYKNNGDYILLRRKIFQRIPD